MREEYRGQGFGRAAVRLAEAACIELAVRALHLEVERGNAAALELYRGQGFRDHDRFLLTKRVAPPRGEEGLAG